GIDEQGDTSRLGHHLTQEIQPLCGQFTTEKIDPCQVAARSGKAGDETQADRVFPNNEDDGDCRGRRLSCQPRTSIERRDHGDLSANQFGRKRRQSIDLIVSPAILDCYVLALDIAGILQALAKCAQTLGSPVRRRGVEEPNNRHRRLLRARRDRPCRRAGKQRYELAVLHSIASSASASSLSGMSRPSDFAVLRLITSANFVGCSTGRSAGFTPRRILSTYPAARRKRSWKSTP